ncbi:MAG: hypothetical protein FJ161_00990 [Gammaproteobacteria bacterium]|nr:hypothetical protein [Gammaproteobacteria bacterium]
MPELARRAFLSRMRENAPLSIVVGGFAVGAAVFFVPAPGFSQALGLIIASLSVATGATLLAAPHVLRAMRLLLAIPDPTNADQEQLYAHADFKMKMLAYGLTSVALAAVFATTFLGSGIALSAITGVVALGGALSVAALGSMAALMLAGFVTANIIVPIVMSVAVLISGIPVARHYNHEHIERAVKNPANNLDESKYHCYAQTQNIVARYITGGAVKHNTELEKRNNSYKK